MPDERQILQVRQREQDRYNPPYTAWCIVTAPFRNESSEGWLAGESRDRRGGHDCQTRARHGWRVKIGRMRL